MSHRVTRQGATEASGWAAKTTARRFDPPGFLAFKREGPLFVLGVMGFAGRWRNPALRPLALARWAERARAMLRAEIAASAREHGERLVVASGATFAGVLRHAYEICAQDGVRAMGITADQALDYALGPMDYVVPVGRVFGDESEAFLQICDAFVLVGGGEQSRRETEAAHAMGKPVTVVQGFGGVADAFTEHALPRARFVRDGGE